MFIPDSGSWFLPILDPGSRIPDPKTATKRVVKKISCHTFYCSHKFLKIENYFIFEMLKKTYGLFTQKIVTKLSKIWDWDLRSGIRKNLFWIPDPGVKKAPDPGSGFATLINTGT
jgi:hypothetical protein